MTSSEPDRWLYDPELVRLRREWVHAYRIWRSVVGEATSVAERRYQDAETAYFARSRRLDDGRSVAELG